MSGRFVEWSGVGRAGLGLTRRFRTSGGLSGGGGGGCGNERSGEEVGSGGRRRVETPRGVVCEGAGVR